MRFLSITVLSAVTLAGVGALWVEDSRGASEHKFMRLPDRTDDTPYSDAVLVGDTLYLAGAIGIDPETDAPPPKIEDEVRIIMESMKTRLEMAGMSMGDLVMVEVYCPDLSLYGQFNDVYRTYFDKHFPARAFVGSGPLLLGGHFEVAGIAVRQ
jgi:enamine deaminase RidA (YjgF/YER057c/UK114 family)